ncbi:16493_t:CDS:2, partial [Dentiscutata erythropus]
MLGASPYHNFDDLEIRICNGLRPEFPKHAPKLFEQLTTQCWNAVPSQRPRAVELKNILNRWHSDVYNDLQAEINDQCKKYEDYLMSNLLKKKIRSDKLTVLKKIKDDPLIKYKFIPPQNSMEDHIIVFEYADSRTLRSYFHNNFSEFSWDDKIKFVRQIADAIYYLHKETIHRDL